MGAPLAGPLSFLLPDPAGAALLAVCLRPDRARAAWRTWEAAGGDLDGHRSLLPLLDEGARRGGVALPADTAARLKAARLHETLRLAAVRGVAGEALERLADAGIDPVVVQDVALAETAYADPTLRHCHALDLLVPAGAARAAAAALQSAGFEARARRGARGPGRELAHATGFPVRIDEHPVAGVHAAGDPAPVLAHARPARIAGRTARVPAPEDALAIACARAATSAERRTLLWACDAARLIESGAPLDWDRVVGVADDWGLGLPIAAQLGWLADALGMPVPAEPLEALARSAGGRRIEAALACARADGRAGPARLLARADGWRERWAVLRWTAAPSAARLRRTDPGAPLLLVYLARPLRWALRSVTRRRPRNPAPGSLDPAAGTDGARSGAPPAPAAGPPSASRRSSG